MKIFRVIFTVICSLSLTVIGNNLYAEEQQDIPATIRQHLRMCVTKFYSLPVSKRNNLDTCQKAPLNLPKPEGVAETVIDTWDAKPIFTVILSDGRSLTQIGERLIVMPTLPKADESTSKSTHGSVTCGVGKGDINWCKTATYACYWHGDVFDHCQRTGYW